MGPHWSMKPPRPDLHGTASLQRHIETLAGTIGERNLWAYSALIDAADYIDREFRAAGYEPIRQVFELSGVPLYNIEATLPGTAPDAIIVLGAHYDTVAGCPGANDNATGIAALLDLARRVRSRQHRTTLRFVAFVNEEPPFFQTAHMGSVVYANNARARGDRIVGMLALETMGYYSDARGSQQYPVPLGSLYPDTGDFIGFVSNVGSARLLMKARRAFKARSSFPLQAAAVPGTIAGVGWSDHWAFWQAGYPAMMVTDTAPFRYPWYHTPEDTPDKIALDRFAQVVDGLEHVVTALAAGSVR
jgi:Zn-dependent M28 family amino/carboxypeptidase